MSAKPFLDEGIDAKLAVMTDQGKERVMEVLNHRGDPEELRALVDHLDEVELDVAIWASAHYVDENPLRQAVRLTRFLEGF